MKNKHPLKFSELAVSNKTSNIDKSLINQSVDYIINNKYMRQVLNNLGDD